MKTSLVIFLSPMLCATYQTDLKLQLYDEAFRGPSPQWYSEEMILHAENLIESYHRLTGKGLITTGLSEKSRSEAAKELFFMPNQIVLSHGCQIHPDGPILNYGNVAALKKWKASWEQLTTLPSSKTAEAINREKRKLFMDEVSKKGIVEIYEGKRVDVEGGSFMIRGVTVWNIVIKGTYLGQAATFKVPEDNQ